jgi:hypothetical protein
LLPDRDVNLFVKNDPVPLDNFNVVEVDYKRAVNTHEMTIRKHQFNIFHPHKRCQWFILDLVNDDVFVGTLNIFDLG